MSDGILMTLFIITFYIFSLLVHYYINSSKSRKYHLTITYILILASFVFHLELIRYKMISLEIAILLFFLFNFLTYMSYLMYLSLKNNHTDKFRENNRNYRNDKEKNNNDKYNE